MKYVFAGVAVALLLAGTAIYLTEPDLRSEIPVIYWVIDPAPARPEQIALFHLWQIEKGHGRTYDITTMAELEAFRARRWSPAIIEAVTDGNADGAAVWASGTTAADLPLRVTVPGAEMRLDAASNELQKKLVQGVSGVAGDVIEAYSGGKQMRYLAAAGMLADVTESAQELGFGPDQTYPALAPALYYDGRQYAFPRNPAQTMYWVNKAAFRQCGQPLPPSRWTLEAFEARGKAFMAAANPPGERPKVFFADRALKVELRRSLGLSMFNETLTQCSLDDARNARVLELIRKWTYDDHILPSAADKASFDVAGGWGGPSFQLFGAARFGLFGSGRWALMGFRKFGTLELAVVEPPHGGFPNTVLSGGQSTVYRASGHRRFAELFLAYMASESYNMQIVRDGDALPPNPMYAETEAFRRPPDYPNEWGCHEAYHNAASEIAVVQSFSPYVLPVVAERYDTMAEEEVLNDRATAAEAAENCAVRINDEIARTVRNDPRLAARHADGLELQAKIDECRRAGRPVPAEWIHNPFHISYYRSQGWLEEAP